MGEGADSDAGEDMWMMWLGAATQCASLCLPESWPWGFHLHRPRLILLQLVVTVGQQWHSTAAALPGPCARIRFSANLKLNAAGEAHLVTGSQCAALSECHGHYLPAHRARLQLEIPGPCSSRPGTSARIHCRTQKSESIRAVISVQMLAQAPCRLINLRLRVEDASRWRLCRR